MQFGNKTWLLGDMEFLFFLTRYLYSFAALNRPTMNYFCLFYKHLTNGKKSFIGLRTENEERVAIDSWR